MCIRDSFHTNDASVFSYLITFTTWHEYQHKVLSYVNGEYVPFPVNLCTLSQIFHEPFTKEKAQQYFQKVQQDPQSCKTFEDIAIASVGADLYEMFYKHYTEKQWGMPVSYTHLDQLTYAILRFAPVYGEAFTLNIDKRILLKPIPLAYYFKNG